MKIIFSMMASAVLGLFLAACGGGGGGSSGQSPSPADPADPGNSPIGANLMCTDSAGSPSGANSCNDLFIMGASFRANVDLVSAIISSLPSRLIKDPGTHGCPGGGTAIADAPPLIVNGQGSLTFDQCVLKNGTYDGVVTVIDRRQSGSSLRTDGLDSASTTFDITVDGTRYQSSGPFTVENSSIGFLITNGSVTVTPRGDSRSYSLTPGVFASTTLSNSISQRFDLVTALSDASSSPAPSTMIKTAAVVFANGEIGPGPLYSLGAPLNRVESENTSYRRNVVRPQGVTVLTSDNWTLSSGLLSMTLNPGFEMIGGLAQELMDTPRFRVSE